MTSGGFLATSFDLIQQWAQKNSLWYFQITGGCCADEILSAQSCKYDLERYGMLPQLDPSQADVLIVSTVVTKKLSAEIKRAYERMLSPKYVIALGACACSGGVFSKQVSYAVESDLSSVIPVDIFIAGCPPRPEAIMDGLILLQRKMSERHAAISKNK